MILTPFGRLPNGQYPSEIVGSLGPDGTYLCPKDPQHNTTGEDGFYNDSHLGGASGPQVIAMGPAPSDFAVATSYGYTPNSRGWVATKEGYVQGPYYPQAPLAGITYPMPLLTLSDAAVPAAVLAPDQAALDREARRKDLAFKLSVASTIAVGISAIIAIVRTSAGLRDDVRTRRQHS